MSSMRLCLTAALVLQSSLLAAAPLDYAWKSSLESQHGELNTLLINAEIIQGLSRDDFGDLLILDADGVAAPSWVRPIKQVNEVVEVPLDIHVFSEYGGSHTKTVKATSESQTKDSRSSVETTEIVRVAKSSNAFVIELSDYQQALGIHTLRVDWNASNTKQLLQLRVEAGNNLSNWQTVHSKITLAKASHSDDGNRDWQLISDIPASIRYVRLSSANPELAMTLNEVSGLYDEPTLQTIEWVSYGPMQNEAAANNAYRFELPAGVLPDRLRLKPAQANQILKGSIYAGGNKYRNKLALFPNIQQHNLAPSANIIPSPSYALPKKRYENWWFESDASLKQAPLIELGYATYELLFLANGTPPYSAYWGNYEAEPPVQLLRDVLDSNKETDKAFQARLKKTEISGGAQRQFAQSSLPWLTWGLWLLLVIAAVLTARMAIGLFREMK